MKLTRFSKFLITLIILAVIFLGGRYFLNNTELGRDLLEQGQQAVEDRGIDTNIDLSKSDDDVLKVQIFTWGGYVPGLYFNEGAKYNENSRFWKDYGLKVDFELIDDFDASRNAWRADEVHLLGNEVSAMAAEMTGRSAEGSAGLDQFDPKIIMQVDWSRGGDAIVAMPGINSVNDLRSKSIAVAPSTPSQTFLIWMLDAANLSLNDVEVLEVPSAIDAATAFKSRKVDAAVVWSPDDEIATRAVPNSTILQSTKEASHIIADIFMVKKKYIDKYPDKIAAFYEGWMKAAAEINANQSNKEKAAKIFADVTTLGLPDAMASINNVYLCTHGDNLNFFGKNIEYKGVTGEKLYTKMGNELEKLDYAPRDRPNWRVMAYPNAANQANLTGPAHVAERGPDFQPVTEADRDIPALATKPISINFATGKYSLDQNAKTIIDIQFADLAKAYQNARIRVEGNTDNVGAKSMNVNLSKKRAQAVADYLKKAYNVKPNRLIVVGNGPDNPVKGCESNATEECKAKNRRTEFQLIR
jgi:NitT/TauT family transport system substrate-binding protein